MIFRQSLIWCECLKKIKIKSMNNFIKERGIDIIFVLTLSLVPIVGLITGAEQTWKVAAVICALVVAYKKTLNKFIVITGISAAISFMATAITVGFISLVYGGSQYTGFFLLIFLLGSIFIIAQGAVAGFIFFKIYSWLIGNRISASANKILLAILFIGIVVFMGSEIKNDRNATNETVKKTEFIKRVTLAIGRNELTQFTNKELIERGVLVGIYTTEGDRIINSYGGDVRISKEDQNIHILYTKIPSKERCFIFYYRNDPRVYGFKVTKVGGTIETYPDFSVEAVDRFKRQVCYSGKKSVDIEFIGTLADIVQESEYMIKNPVKY